ncbi:MAG: biosynthetic-type acetolactate synthase large subunit [Candidatus Omnitrophica bacterium]|nr:biosynthetic-type acetolactate synthase large subunit [Candidatus Omnitrophota bacterium]
MISISGAQVLVKKLIEHNVKFIFEFPGGSIAPILDEIHKSKRLETVISKHEQGAAHAADAYARITGKPSVCMATSGPGASNLVTGIANAYMDSVPMVVITGQVAEWDMRGDTSVRQHGFQELDIVQVVKSITKKTFSVKRIEDIPKIIDEAFFIAESDRPGPVLIDIPINLQYTRIYYKKAMNKICKFKPKNLDVSTTLIKKAIKGLTSSKRPLIFVGGGIISARCIDKLKYLTSKYNIPVCATLMGLNSITSYYKYNLGLVGYSGSKASNLAIENADLILALGIRFDNRAFPDGQKCFSKDAYIIHVDCDKAELNHRVIANLSLHSDLKIFLDKFIKELNRRHFKINNNWLNQIVSWKKKYYFHYAASKSVIKPQRLLEDISDLVKNKKVIFTTDVGQHQLWAAQFLKLTRPNTFITSGGLGTMGFGLPAAIGCQLADRKALIINVTSDGSFQMNIQELATIAYYKLPIKIIMLNNRCLGLVRQIQEFAFGGRYASTKLDHDVDFCKIVSAYGIKSLKVSEPSKLKEYLRKLIEYKGSAFLEVRIKEDENLFPIRIAGKIRYR